MDRVTAIYFLLVSFLGQALGPLLVGHERRACSRGARRWRSALFTGLFGLAMLVSVEVLQRRLRTAAPTLPNAPEAPD